MHDKDTANTMPGNGHLSAPHEASHSDAPSIAHSKVEELPLPWHILVVEDDTSLANLEADVLAASGYAVRTARNGELAVIALHESVPDLVVLDLELPGRMTGWDVLQVLRTHSRVPVLLTSSETFVRKRMRTHGETKLTLDHLPKPYPIQALLKRIKRMLVS